jgi:transposase
MTAPRIKKVSESKRERRLRETRRVSRAAFHDEKRGKFFQRERAAALLYKEDARLSLREAEDELRDAALRRKLGLRKPLSKSALHRAPLLLGVEGRRALLRASVKKTRAKRVACADSTGVTTTRYARWRADKKNAKNYRKLHALVDASSRQVIAARVTKGTRHDSPQFKRLLAQARDLSLTLVAGDPGYASRENAQLAEDAGAQPFFKPKKNATARTKRSPAWRRMVSAFREDAEAWLAFYRQPRSAVEALWSALKRLFGSALRAVRWHCQRAELELRVVAYNIRVGVLLM